MKALYGKNTLPSASGYESCKLFGEGSEIILNMLLNHVQLASVILENRRIKVRRIAFIMCISVGRVHIIIHDGLGLEYLSQSVVDGFGST